MCMARAEERGRRAIVGSGVPEPDTLLALPREPVAK